jgi:hypothetical protein
VRVHRRRAEKPVRDSDDRRGAKINADQGFIVGGCQAQLDRAGLQRAGPGLADTQPGARSRNELVAYGIAAGLVMPPCRNPGSGTVSETIGAMTTVPADNNSVRIGYARVSTRAQEHQAQLDALAAAYCREIIVETASTRDDRPRLREVLGQLRAGDTLVIYKPDRVARSMKELLVMLED